ncbi:MAG: DUF2080 family transposase-associated protein [Nanoarchaeota archaeon]|nr:DUF2080 family transposase-associated protein [Nanoarchaeota archaeon]
MELTKNVIGWGNSAGVLLPREWKGNEVKVILVDRTSQIKKEVFDILDKYLEDVIGVYLVGSYARKEEEKDSDIDIIAISHQTNKSIHSGKYHITISPLESIEKALKADAILIYPRIIEAKTILNQQLLRELREVKISKNSFKEFIDGTKRIIKMNKEFIELDKLDGELLTSTGVVYSLILRLRGIFMVKAILKKSMYSNKDFKKWIVENIPSIDYEGVYRVYRAIKEDKKTKEEIKISDAEKLLGLLEKEVKKW